MPDEVARIGALSNGSNGQRSLESASLHFERHCGVTLSLSKRESAREILSDLKLAEGSRRIYSSTPSPNLSKTKPPRNPQPKSLSAVSLLHHSQIVNEANYSLEDFLGFNFAYNQLPFPIY
jgi:hypothetical protein